MEVNTNTLSSSPLTPQLALSLSLVRLHAHNGLHWASPCVCVLFSVSSAHTRNAPQSVRPLNWTPIQSVTAASVHEHTRSSHRRHTFMLPQFIRTRTRKKATNKAERRATTNCRIEIDRDRASNNDNKLPYIQRQSTRNWDNAYTKRYCCRIARTNLRKAIGIGITISSRCSAA